MADEKPRRSHTEEAKRKMSETRKAKIAAGLIKIHNRGNKEFGAEWRDKSSAACAEASRKPKTEDHRQKISKGLTGHKVSEETRAKIAEKMRGELNWNWKNGKSDKTIGNLRNSIEYRAWRIQVLARDGYKCVFCSGNTQLQADHIKQFAYYVELRFEVSNGRTLCKACHKEVTRQQTLARNSSRSKIERGVEER